MIITIFCMIYPSKTACSQTAKLLTGNTVDHPFHLIFTTHGHNVFQKTSGNWIAFVIIYFYVLRSQVVYRGLIPDFSLVSLKYVKSFFENCFLKSFNSFTEGFFFYQITIIITCCCHYNCFGVFFCLTINN